MIRSFHRLSASLVRQSFVTLNSYLWNPWYSMSQRSVEGKNTARTCDLAGETRDTRENTYFFGVWLSFEGALSTRWTAADLSTVEPWNRKIQHTCSRIRMKPDSVELDFVTTFDTRLTKSDLSKSTLNTIKVTTRVMIVGPHPERIIWPSLSDNVCEGVD